MPSRIQVHFDDELVIISNSYYYRGTPTWSDVRLEFKIGVKTTDKLTQKEITLAKEEKLAEYKLKGVRNLKDNFRSLSEPYIAERVEEAKDPKLLSQSSLKETKQLMNGHLVPYFGNYKPHDIDQPLWNDYCMEKRRAKVKGRKKVGLNLKNHRKVMNHFMKWLFHNKAMKNLVAFEIPKRARVAHRERIIPEEWEILSIFEHSHGNLLLYVSMYALNAIRNYESLASRWDDYDLEKGVMYVRGENNRTRKDRSIPLNPFVLDLLRARKKTATSPWIFPNQRSKGKTPHKPKGAMHKVFKVMLKRAGVNSELTPHDLRAFFETHMAQNEKFTDTQREKMAGANIDVQKRIYIKMQAKNLKGLEKSVQVDGLNSLLSKKLKITRGEKTGEKETKKQPSKRVSIRKKRGKKK